MDREAFDKELRSELKKLSLSPTDEQAAQFFCYFQLLDEWNKKQNLTTVTAPEDVIRRHFADSLSPMTLLPKGKEVFEASGVIDVGTGAGFPGIPLKIMNPAMQLTLLDSQQKRTSFLSEVRKELKLTGVDILKARAEDAGHEEKYRGMYDVCVSRAVAKMSVLSEYCLAFVRAGGEFIAYKSANIEEELKDSATAIALLGGEVRDVYTFDTPDGGRSLVVIEKKEETPEKYPRKAGKPGKAPL